MHPTSWKRNYPKFAPGSARWHHAHRWRSGVGKEAQSHACEGEYLRGFPDQIDDSLRQAREQVLPRAKEMDGFKGLIALGDRQSGKTLGITLWESEEAMRASEEAANRMRSESAEASGEQIAGVERYEVGLFEVES